MPISIMHFNWLPRPSPYAQAQNWTIRQRILRQQTEDLAAVGDLFASAAADQANGMMNLAAQAGLARTQAAARAKANAVLDSAFTPAAPAKSSDVKLADGSTLRVDPTQYLPGGSKLNLSAGTLTFPDGTVIDTTTGLKKVNLTV